MTESEIKRYLGDFVYFRSCIAEAVRRQNELQAQADEQQAENRVEAQLED